MRGQTVILRGPDQRSLAKRLIDAAPVNAVVNVQEERRTLSQSDHMWALLSDLSRAKPEGRHHTPDMWKALCMQACGHECQFMLGLDGRPFPVGFKSSRLTKAEMSNLIDWIMSYGAEHGVKFNHPQDRAA